MGDFQLPGGTVGLIISEKEYTGDGRNFYKKRVVKFYKAFKGHPSVILCLYDSQNNSQTNFIDLQEFCVLEFGFSLIPIKNLDQVPQVVEQLILVRNYQVSQQVLHRNLAKNRLMLRIAKKLVKVCLHFS